MHVGDDRRLETGHHGGQAAGIVDLGQRSHARNLIVWYLVPDDSHSTSSSVTFLHDLLCPLVLHQLCMTVGEGIDKTGDNGDMANGDKGGYHDRLDVFAYKG